MKIAIYSAGHEPQIPGAVVNGIREYDLNKKFVDARVNGLVVPTFESDSEKSSLRKKIDWVNEHCTKDNVAIEIHQNTSLYPSKNGVEVYYYDEGDKELALKIDRAIANRLLLKVGATKKVNRDNNSLLGCYNSFGSIVSDDRSNLGFLGWVRLINCPSVIVECGYLTNEKDRERLLDPNTPRMIMEAINMAINGEDVFTLKQKLADALSQLVGLLKALIQLKK